MSGLNEIIKELKLKNSICGLKKSDLYNLGLSSSFFFDENNSIPDDEEWSCTVDASFENIEIRNNTFNLGKIVLEFQNLESIENSTTESLFTEKWNEFVKQLKYQRFYISYKKENSIVTSSIGVIENCPLNTTNKDLLRFALINDKVENNNRIYFTSEIFNNNSISVSSKEKGKRTSNFLVIDYGSLLIENFKHRLKEIISSEVEVIDEPVLFEIFKDFKLEVRYIFDCRYLDIALNEINYKRDYSPINLSGTIKYIVRKIDLNKIYYLKGRDLRKVGITDNVLKASQRYAITVEDNYYTIENEQGHTKVYKDLKYSYKKIDEREELIRKINNFLKEAPAVKNNNNSNNKYKKSSKW